MNLPSVTLGQRLLEDILEGIPDAGHAFGARLHLHFGVGLYFDGIGIGFYLRVGHDPKNLTRLPSFFVFIHFALAQLRFSAALAVTPETHQLLRSRPTAMQMHLWMHALTGVDQGTLTYLIFYYYRKIWLLIKTFNKEKIY